MKHMLKILTAAALVAASEFVANAQPYAIAGNFNGWNNTASFAGTPPVYTNIMTGGTAGSWEGVKVIAVPGSWNTTYPNNNLNMTYDAGGSNTLYFYPGTFLDGWNPTQNRVGFEDPGNMAFEIVGDFDSPNWSTLANGGLTLQGNGVYTNTYVVPSAGTHYFTIRTPGQWGNFRCGADFSDSANGSFTTATPNQSVLIQLDLPNGRWLIGPPPVVCFTRFQVDMTLVVATDPGFNPSSVTVNGSPFGWGGTTCTNDPNAANTNIYSAVIPMLAGTPVQFQYRYSNGGTVYDALNGQSGNNRTLTVPSLTSTNLPVVYFNDAAPTDLLNVATTVTFTVNMTNAVGYTNWVGNVGTLEHIFDPNADIVFVNGDFSGWLGWNPIALAGYQFVNDPVGSGLYTFTTTFPIGHPRSLTYKYSINGVDDEAGFAQNHFRYIRSTTGTEVLPMDTFGVQYSEPKVGGLTIAHTAGTFPINWLSYPNVKLQSSSNLVNWVDVPNTLGASSTNWPAGSATTFFRLAQ